MFFYVFIVCGFGVLLWLVVSLAKDGARIAKENEILNELDKQKQKSKDRDNLTDDDLKEWLNQFKKQK